MPYTRRVYYQIILTIITIGMIWSAELEKGCERSVATRANSLIQIECNHLPVIKLPQHTISLTVLADLRVINKEVLETSSMLNELNISNCNITNIQDGAFSNMYQLEILILTNNHIDYIEESMFRNLQQLTELHIDRNNLKVIIPGSLKGIAKLRILNLDNNQLLEIPAELPKNLEILNVANNDIEYIDMGSLKNMENLEILNLGNNSIKNWPKDNISLPSLTNISLGSSITTAQIKGFLFPNLKYLHLSAKSIDNATFQGITISEAYCLEQLILENYKLYDLQFSESLKALRTLELKGITYYGKDITYLPSDLIKLVLEESPGIANLLINSNKTFHQLRTMSLKNSNITIINQANQLMKTIDNLDISQNPIRCSVSEWKWIYDRILVYPSFLIDPNNVMCNTPSELRGKQLFTVLTDFFDVEEQRKVTFMKIMEQYVAVYGQENGHLIEEIDTMDVQQNVSNNNIIYGILIALTLMGTLFIFIHFCHKTPNCATRNNNVTIEYSRSSEQINFRKNNSDTS